MGNFVYCDKDWLENKYINQKMSMDSISREAGCSIGTIFKWIHRYGIQTRPPNGKSSAESRRKNKFNIGIFDEWSHDMAYILGYAFADGCVISHEMSAELIFVSTDKSLIDNVVETTKYEGRIYTKYSDKYRTKYSVNLSHANLQDRLLEFNLVPRKSLIAHMPYIPVEFIGDFLRGNFDGDGTTRLDERRYGSFPTLSITFMSGSLEFMYDMQYVTRQIGLSKRKLYKHRSCYELVFSSASDIIRLYKSMYGNAGSLFLDRKHDKFVKYFDIFNCRVNSLPRKTTIHQNVIDEISKYGTFS